MIRRLLLFALFFAAGCAAEPRIVADPAAEAGFWLGCWHGMILPFAFIASWFTDVAIYEARNTGFWYNLGYFLGVGGLGSSGSAAGSASARPHRRGGR